MIDHLGISVSNFQKSKEFYKTALAPLGYEITSELSPDDAETKGEWVAGFGSGPDPQMNADFWIYSRGNISPAIHICFRAKSEGEVKAFYEAALNSGGHDNGEPGLRPEYSGRYYAAFIIDPDGHNIEAVFHGDQVV